jgi:hypothetical protein
MRFVPHADICTMNDSTLAPPAPATVTGLSPRVLVPLALFSLYIVLGFDIPRHPRRFGKFSAVRDRRR